MSVKPVHQTCFSCTQPFYPDLVAPRSCYHVFHYTTCLAPWLKLGSEPQCPVCRVAVPVQDGTTDLPTYVNVFMSYFQKDPKKVKGVLKTVDSASTNHCSVCDVNADEEYPKTYLWAENLYHDRCIGTDVPPEAVALTARHFVQVVQELSSPKKPSAPRSPTKTPPPSFDKVPLSRPMLGVMTIVSFCAFVINRFAFHGRNPILFILGLPFFLLAKLLFVTAAGIKAILE